MVQESGIKNSKLVVLRTRTGTCLTAHNPVHMIKLIACFCHLNITLLSAPNHTDVFPSRVKFKLPVQL